MASKKNSSSLYKSIINSIPKLQLGNDKEVMLPAQVKKEKTRFKAGPSKLITLISLVVLLGLVKLFNLDGRLKNWFNDYQSQFQQPAPEAIEVGTVCNLLMELEEKKSILLQDPEDKVLEQLDTMILGGLDVDSVDAVMLQTDEIGGAVAAIDLNELVYFETLTQERARLMFYNGNSQLYDLGSVLQLIRDQDKCHFFQSVSFEGQAYEYFNILYTDVFEKVNCKEGIFYRARLNIAESNDPAVRTLLNCGTDLFSSYIYQKTRRRLEFLNPNSDYSYRTEVTGEECGCG